MKKVLGAIAITAAMLATTADFAENTSAEKRAELAKLWGRDTAGASQAADTRKNFTGISSSLRNDTGYGHGAWSGNYRGGRVHPPAGR